MFENQSISREEIQQFNERGVIHIREAFPKAAALEMQNFMWSQLQERHGVDRNNPATWTLETYELNQTATDPVYGAIASPRLCAVIDSLLGPASWSVPQSWGGFLMTFPEGAPDAWKLKGRMWHWDGEPDERPDTLGGLFIFLLFSKIESHGGGTLLVSGSHRLVNRHYAELPEHMRKGKRAPIRREFIRKYLYFDDLLEGDLKAAGRERHYMHEDTLVDGVPLRVIETIGEPGDAYICHPTIFHSASYNHANTPRFMRVKALPARTLP